MRTKQSVVEWRIKNYEKYREITRKHDREYYYRIRNELYELLGDKCKNCGFSDRRAFQIDHVNGGGNSRKIVNRNGMGKTRQVLEQVRNGSREYQLLCANCNVIKKIENREVKGHLKVVREDYINRMIKKRYVGIPN